MTITSGSALPGRRSAPVAITLVEVPEPIIESIGVDDPEIARGGRPRRTPGPPVNGDLVTRVRPPVVLPTRVRRIGMDARGEVNGGNLAATRPAPTPAWPAEMVLFGR
jgi:hypothetical protein